MAPVEAPYDFGRRDSHRSAVDHEGVAHVNFDFGWRRDHDDRWRWRSKIYPWVSGNGIKISLKKFILEYHFSSALHSAYIMVLLYTSNMDYLLDQLLCKFE